MHKKNSGEEIEIGDKQETGRLQQSQSQSSLDDVAYVKKKVHPVLQRLVYEALVTKPSDTIVFMTQFLSKNGSEIYNNKSTAAQ